MFSWSGRKDSNLRPLTPHAKQACVELKAAYSAEFGYVIGLRFDIAIWHVSGGRFNKITGSVCIAVSLVRFVVVGLMIFTY